MANSAECPNCERALSFGAKSCRCGWKAKKDYSGTLSIPDKCSVFKCENDTVVVFVVARKENGEFIKVRGSKIFTDKGKEREGYTFIEWITRCVDCYLRELDVMKKSHLEPLDKLKEFVKNREEEKVETRPSMTVDEEAELLSDLKQVDIEQTNAA